MNLATPTTEASAARKRGGGLARPYLLTLLLIGRPARFEGGETKSLCRAAAGITSALPSACGSLAYPTTGVRRAQELSLSLRSPTPPAAQLVEGYTHLPEIAPHHSDVQWITSSCPCQGHATPLSRKGVA